MILLSPLCKGFSKPFFQALVNPRAVAGDRRESAPVGMVTRNRSRRYLSPGAACRDGQRKRRAAALRGQFAVPRVSAGRNQRKRTPGEAQADPRRGDPRRVAATRRE